MSKTIRAKFEVRSITTNKDGAKTISMVPVFSGSPENKEFWKYTPSGTIEILVTNEDAQFEFGEYFIDFTKA